MTPVAPKAGKPQPPLSREEAESRVLRAWRTLNASPDYRYPDVRRLQRRGHSLRTMHAVPHSSDDPDCLYALAWMNHLSEPHRNIIRLRAADPPYSWAEIGRREHLSRQGARARYQAAIDALWKVARGAGADDG